MRLLGQSSLTLGPGTIKAFSFAFTLIFFVDGVLLEGLGLLGLGFPTIIPSRNREKCEKLFCDLT